MATKTKFTAEDKKAYAEKKRAEQVELLEKAVDALTSEKGWLNYLTMASKFHNYSFNNRILIALQRPDATHVAGAGTWYKEFERTVKKDGTQKVPGILILRPMIVYLKDKNGKDVLDGKGKKVIDRIWFKSIDIWDVSDTEGKPLPSAPELRPLTGDSHYEYLLRAEAFINSMGYTVDYDSLYGSDKRGYADLIEKVIHVNGTLPANSQVRTLIHEIAHIVGGIDYADYTHHEAEIIVESAAFVATGLVGLDTSDMSVPYITNWSEDASDPKAALKLMKAFTKTIDEIADAIVEGIS